MGSDGKNAQAQAQLPLYDQIVSCTVNVKKMLGPYVQAKVKQAQGAVGAGKPNLGALGLALPPPQSSSAKGPTASASASGDAPAAAAADESRSREGEREGEVMT